MPVTESDLEGEGGIGFDELNGDSVDEEEEDGRLYGRLLEKDGERARFVPAPLEGEEGEKETLLESARLPFRFECVCDGE